MGISQYVNKEITNRPSRLKVLKSSLINSKDSPGGFLEKNYHAKVLIRFRKNSENIEQEPMKQTKIYQRKKKATKEEKGAVSSD